MKFLNIIEITGEDWEALGRIISESIQRLIVPKNKKNKIGIVIALKTENNNEKIG